MAFNESILGSITPDLSKSILDLIFWVKAVGFLFIVYLVIVVVRWILNFIRNIRIKKMYHRIEEMDKKLDRLLEINRKDKK